jgi:predicted nuclease with TOPRIM domain
MESVLNLIFSAENVRMLVLLVFGFSCFVWLKMSFEKRIDGLRHDFNDLKHDFSDLKRDFNDLKRDFNDLKRDFDDLKHNHFAHLCRTIEALTFTLEKNGYLKREDKEYIDSRLK